MRKQLVAVAVALAFVAGAGAQQSQGSKAAAKARTMEAVVTVTKIDPANRTVHVETPKGQTVVSIPAETNLDQIREGSRYKVRYSEPVAVAIAAGAQGSASGGATASVTPKVGATGTGTGVKMDKVAGVIEQINLVGKQLVLRTSEGGKQTYSIGDGVAPRSLKPGDAVTLTYQQAVATQMVSTPQPVTDPAPAQ